MIWWNYGCKDVATFCFDTKKNTDDEDFNRGLISSLYQCVIHENSNALEH